MGCGHGIHFRSARARNPGNPETAAAQNEQAAARIVPSQWSSRAGARCSSEFALLVPKLLLVGAFSRRWRESRLAANRSRMDFIMRDEHGSALCACGVVRDSLKADVSDYQRELDALGEDDEVS